MSDKLTHPSIIFQLGYYEGVSPSERNVIQMECKSLET